MVLSIMQCQRMTEQMQQKPSVGRIVHFEDGCFGTCAAIITDVKDNGSVCLALFHKSPSGTIEKSVVYHIAEYREKPTVGY